MKRSFYFLLAVLFVSFFSSAQSGRSKSSASGNGTGLIDVWDFGAEQLNTSVYNNLLSVSVINGWYSSSITAGSVATTNLFPSSWTVGALKWTGGTNDRLRTANTSLTRYDTPAITTIADTTLAGYVYVNASAATGRFFTLTLNEDDEVTLYMKAQNGAGVLNFVYQGTSGTQSDTYTPVSTAGSVVKFVAKFTGDYKIYDSFDKPFYFRILRKMATYKYITGNVDTSLGTDIPAGYGVRFTNAAGKSWTATASSNAYNVTLPSGYTYSVSLVNANGYIITTSKTLTVTDATSSFHLSVMKVDLHTLTGTVSGLGSYMSKSALVFTPTISSVFVPEPVYNTTTGAYSVQLEANTVYTVSATGVNDFSIADNTVTVAAADLVKDLVFAAKPTYAITLTTPDLNTTQTSVLAWTFKNLNETSYSYTFAAGTTPVLRDGVYSVTASGLAAYPLKQSLTSNLNVNGGAAGKTVHFSPVTNWSFDDATITTSVANYKGMQFTGTVSNEVAKGHLLLGASATAKVPVKANQKLTITYYYSANFTIDGGAAITATSSSGSTSVTETAKYAYSGTSDGYVTLAGVSGTTYITDITVTDVIPYAATITVGTDKTYKTINAALTAVRSMNRPNGERVKIMIDPGNYEEMLVVDVDSVSLMNASASPTIGLLNQGVSIDANAVRITSYYGHGYNYYSMGTDQLWSADVLQVNKENGYYSYVNTGGVTTNNSYWNTTVRVVGAGFRAENIIFENSYNQYISQKESEDVVVEWSSGGKGTRPTTVGSVAVQNKSFVERAAAIAFQKSADKAVLYKCRVIGRQDSFYGAEGARVVAYKGSLMGGTDYLFGGMTLVAYKSDLAMNTSEASTDVAYLTAPQQGTSRGFLLYACTVTSAKPGSETASAYTSKPGEFGRPWSSTGEAIFYNTTIEKSGNISSLDKSLILQEGWLNSLGSTSARCGEYGTIELSGEDNQALRALWSYRPSTAVLTDGTAITTFNFTKGTDNWDPIPGLIAYEDAGLSTGLGSTGGSSVGFYVKDNLIYVQGQNQVVRLEIYSVDGVLIKSVAKTNGAGVDAGRGARIIKAITASGVTVTKLVIP